MLEITLLELLLRGIPEAFLFIFAAYAFSKKFIEPKRFIISSIVYAIMVYMIRLLPIHYGVHVILNLFVLIVLTFKINKIDLVKAIQVSIAIIILQFICEGINVLLIQYVFRFDVGSVFNNPILKILYGIPSMLIFALIAGVYYIRLLKRKELKGIQHGELIK